MRDPAAAASITAALELVITDHSLLRKLCTNVVKTDHPNS